tara:strand:- start:297 stop:827 length:531 start_codon:yes stop_codon:yes gene_type:complete
MAKDDDVKPEVIDVDQMKRENFFNLGRDDYMSLEEYLRSSQSDNDLRSKRGKSTLPKNDRMSDKDKKVDKKIKQFIMDLPTNAPRTKELKAIFRGPFNDNASKTVEQAGKGKKFFNSGKPLSTEKIKQYRQDLKSSKSKKRGGTQLGDLDKDGKMSGYEKVRQKAIQKSMAAQKNK